MSKTPHIVSRVNGIKIPLLPHQGGILHRFTNEENQLVIAKVSEESIAIKDSDERMVVSESEPSEVPSTPARGRKPKEEVTL